MKRTTITTLLFLVTFFHFASAQTTFKIEVTNTLNKNRTDVPIVIKLGNLKQNQAKRVLWQSALITDTRNNNDTIPNQLDDIDQDGIGGDIIDIFTPSSAEPYRITLFDNEIESIRKFNLQSQLCAKEELESLEIPSSTIVPLESNT